MTNITSEKQSNSEMQNQNIQFENHFSARVMEILFPDGYSIQTRDDVQYLKTKWMNNLKSWHMPYTCVFDLRNLNLAENFQKDFLKMIQFFERLHMKKIIGFKVDTSLVPSVSFEVYPSYDLAIQHTGLAKGAGLTRNLESLRDRIQIENDFQAHVMEISFLGDTILQTKADVLTLKSKVQNILRLWHTPYSVLVNCVNLKFSEEAKLAFPNFEKFLKGLFCKEIIGYSPCDNKDSYPFKTFRARHAAAGQLKSQSEGNKSGDSAHCGPKLR